MLFTAVSQARAPRRAAAEKVSQVRLPHLDAALHGRNTCDTRLLSCSLPANNSSVGMAEGCA